MKIILLLLCLFNLTLGYESYTMHYNKSLEINGNEDQSFQIMLDDKSSFENYIDISFDPEGTDKINPFVLASTQENCDSERIYMGTQIYGKIHFFIQKNQFSNDQFFICIKSRKESDVETYKLTLKNEEKAILSLDTQTTYYVQDYNLETITFVFQPQSTDLGSQATIWIKGKSIEKPEISANNFKEKQFDYGYLYYGTIDNSDIKLTITNKIGDLVTVGSTLIKEEKTEELKINANEIMIATEEKVCIPLEFDFISPSHITGKIYTRKAKSYFTDLDGKVIDRKEKTEIRIENGIISEINVVGEELKPEKGFYCLESIKENDKLIVFSIQITKNAYMEMVHPTLLPGEIRQHFLMNGETAIFYGMKPDDNSKEVNLILKSLKGYSKMYFADCKEFPYCTYNQDEFKTLINPPSSNKITVYSFYRDVYSEYKTYNPISLYQPLMVVHCEEGGREEEILSDNLFCLFETSYFTDKDTVHLYEDSSFSQYLLQNEEDKYQINIEGEEKLDRIYIDMMIFSGDADLILYDFNGEANKYYLSNKIFYSIHTNGYTKETIEFSVKANYNTFYILQYQLMKESNQDKNMIESGVNYI